jgi:hypothetical protein
MLGLPMVSVLLPSLLLFSDAISLTPLIIVGVVTSYVVSARISPAPSTAPAPETPRTH